ncbi:hypothetical protein GQ54DRAFT_298506 [Martensiomyces pterosporus]|nr:hypothetical protein GQ54DRAFT_298506 [Martensiomyces pterosporus]
MHARSVIVFLTALIAFIAVGLAAPAPDTGIALPGSGETALSWLNRLLGPLPIVGPLTQALGIAPPPQQAKPQQQKPQQQKPQQAKPQQGPKKPAGPAGFPPQQQRPMGPAGFPPQQAQRPPLGGGFPQQPAGRPGPGFPGGAAPGGFPGGVPGGFSGPAGNPGLGSLGGFPGF